MVLVVALLCSSLGTDAAEYDSDNSGNNSDSYEYDNDENPDGELAFYSNVEAVLRVSSAVALKLYISAAFCGTLLIIETSMQNIEGAVTCVALRSLVSALIYIRRSSRRLTALTDWTC